jgi:hypothetical protein
MSQLWFFIAFVIVLALIGAAAWLVRRFGGGSIGSSTNRGRMPRLAVIDAATVDGRRKLVLVRRDNVEHLLMIGGPTDVVVEPNIVRGVPQRDQAAPRAPIGTDLPVPARLPDAAWSETEAPRAEAFEHREPPISELPPRPARTPHLDEPRRTAAERHAPDTAPSFVPEPMVRAEPPHRPLPRSERIERTERTEPVLPRMPRSTELPPRTPPARPRPPADTPLSSADQNLADMAQRLEAALRRPAPEARPAPAEPRAPSVSPADRIGAPPVAPETEAGRTAPRVESAPPAPPPESKAAFENLEDEMASLLGRQKPPA